MTRAERRRAEREARKTKFNPNPNTFILPDNLDKALKRGIEKELQRVREEARDEAIGIAMVLLLTLPLEVLMDHYWQKSYAQRIPKFTELVLEYYRRWQDGEIDIEDLKKDLWEYGGVRLEAGGTDD